MLVSTSYVKLFDQCSSHKLFNFILMIETAYKILEPWDDVLNCVYQC